MTAHKSAFSRSLVCGNDYEEAAYADGATSIAGLDEVGRGTWFGPVTAAAVILPRHYVLDGVKDSKQVSAKKRRELAERIKGTALAWSVAHVSAAEIDRTDIAAATEMAMYEAIHGLHVLPDYLLIDAILVDIPITQLPIVHGDAVSLTIAAASIVAKVERDRLMDEFETQFPGYGIADHKGYGTAQHLTALEMLGPTCHHRMSFAPLRRLHRQRSTPPPPGPPLKQIQMEYSLP